MHWSETARYWLAVMLVVSIPPAVGWWLVVHPLAGAWRKVGPKVTMALMMALLAASIYGLFLVRGSLVGKDLGGSLWLAIAGLPFIVAAALIALRRRKYLTTRILIGVPEVDPDNKGELITEGIYSKVRNPRYLEVVLALIGYSLAANYWGPYWMTLAIVPAIHLVVLMEESELRERFGPEYLAYCARVPRYFPRRRNQDPLEP